MYIYSSLPVFRDIDCLAVDEDYAVNSLVRFRDT